MDCSCADTLVLSASAATSAAARRFCLCVVFMVVIFPWFIGISIRSLHLRLLPLSVEDFGLGDVDAHDAVERSIGRGQPVGFLVRAGRILPGVKRQRTVV